MTGRGLVSFAQIVVPEQWIVYHSFENASHVATHPHVPDTSDAGGVARLLGSILPRLSDGAFLKELGM